MKKFLVLPAILFLWSCGGGEHKPLPTEETMQETPTTTNPDPNTNSGDTKYADDAKGFGKFKDVDVPAHLDEKLASSGQKVFDVKCASCHRLDDKKLVGPGWKGVTERRTPAWIMNFVTNVDENLDKDPQSMAMLEECLVRMPNQNLTDQDARDVLEFMRKNDGVK